MGKFDLISPIDYRYMDKEVMFHLFEESFIFDKVKVEAALIEVLFERGICSKEIKDEILTACQYVTAEEVYEEENRVKHDIRALVNCIQKRVSDEAKRFVHLTATSYDIVDTANAKRIKDAVTLLYEELKKLEKVLIALTLKEAETPQIGRTHGQHAMPITFGFAMASFVSRLGQSTQELLHLKKNIRGKFSGAVGAYNASSLLFGDPRQLERDVLEKLGLAPGEHSTQIVQPEPCMRLFNEIVMIAGILGNLARDMRNLQRTEIGEVGEEFGANQVGSSTMPQKRNPINFENVESTWKIIVGRMVTVYLDQISEHQRDLTGSASGRTAVEMIGYLISMVRRMTKVMGRLKVDNANLKRNLEMQGDLILAEPLYILLAFLGHPDAHEKVRQLTLKAQAEGKSLQNVAQEDEELVPYFSQMNEKQKEILSDPYKYTGIAAKKAADVANNWKFVMGGN